MPDLAGLPAELIDGVCNYCSKGDIISLRTVCRQLERGSRPKLACLLHAKLCDLSAVLTPNGIGVLRLIVAHAEFRQKIQGLSLLLPKMQMICYHGPYICATSKGQEMARSICGMQHQLQVDFERSSEALDILTSIFTILKGGQSLQYLSIGTVGEFRDTVDMDTMGFRELLRDLRVTLWEESVDESHLKTCLSWTIAHDPIRPCEFDGSLQLVVNALDASKFGRKIVSIDLQPCSGNIGCCSPPVCSEIGRSRYSTVKQDWLLSVSIHEAMLDEGRLLQLSDLDSPDISLIPVSRASQVRLVGPESHLSANPPPPRDATILSSLGLSHVQQGLVTDFRIHHVECSDVQDFIRFIERQQGCLNKLEISQVLLSKGSWQCMFQSLVCATRLEYLHIRRLGEGRVAATQNILHSRWFEWEALVQNNESVQKYSALLATSFRTVWYDWDVRFTAAVVNCPRNPIAKVGHLEILARCI